MMMTIDDDDELLSLRSPRVAAFFYFSAFGCLGLNGRKGVECALHADLRNNMW